MATSKRCITVPDDLWEEFGDELVLMDAKKSTIITQLIRLFLARRREKREKPS